MNQGYVGSSEVDENTVLSLPQAIKLVESIAKDEPWNMRARDYLEFLKQHLALDERRKMN